MKTIKDSKGFTLIEILAVIAIIGILSTLLIPSVGSMMAKARKTRAINNLRQIAMSYMTYVNDVGSAQALNSATKLSDWASRVARRTGINNAEIFILPEDFLVENSSVSIPKLIGRRTDSGWVTDSTFENFPLSFTVIVGLSSSANPSTTPLAYTRGLDPDSGMWKEEGDNDGGVYGLEGGFIVFLDGHVEYFDSISGDHPLVNFSDGTPTTSIRDAVNSGAKALNWEGVVWSK